MDPSSELTAQEVADLLHVSRPHVLRLLEHGELPSETVAGRRRIRLEHVLAYRDRRNAQRRHALRHLTELAEEVPGGYP